MNYLTTRIGSGALALVLLLLALPATGTASVTSPGSEDARWLPWIGCWDSVEEGEDGDSLLVCFRYLGDGTGVEIVTYSMGEEIAREEVRSDGVRLPVEDGGCEGERWARWSEDGYRVFLHSRMVCGEGILRSTQGVLAIQDQGTRWVELHAVDAGDTQPIIGLRTFRPASASHLDRLGIVAPDQERRLAVATARARASSPLTTEKVAELHSELGSFGTQTFLVRQGTGFQLNAAGLHDLKSAGVAEEVLDVMVGLSYPERFAIRDDGTAQPRTPERTVQERRPPVRVLGYSPWGSYYYWGYSPYGIYSPYGYGWGYPGRYSPVVIIRPPSVEPLPRGRVDPVTGYRAPSRTGRTATPSSGTTSPPPSQPSTGTATSTPSSDRGTASPPPPPVRRAVPRPPPDPDGA